MTPGIRRQPSSSLTAARWRVAILLTMAMMVLYFGFILLVAFNKPLLGREIDQRLEPRHPARRAGHRRVVGAHLDLHPLGQHALRRGRRAAAGPSTAGTAEGVREPVGRHCAGSRPTRPPSPAS